MEQLNNPTIKFYSVEHWEKNWEEMISRVENGEHIGIENENGNKAVMIPADDELIRIHTELNNDGFSNSSSGMSPKGKGLCL